MMECDFLVIGSGIAGLNFALQASEFGKVCLITKKDLIESNTNFAQGGIAAVFSSSDSFEMHMKDTLKAGDGISDKNVVRIMVKNAPKEIERLLSLGTNFDHSKNLLELGKEGGHSRKRIVHKGDRTGMEVERSLVNNVKRNKKIKVFEKHLAFDLIIENGECTGAMVYDKKGKAVVDFFAKAVALATGGLCEIYENTSNPDIATGDGVALGFRAGCVVKDIEFIQFHPTGFRIKGHPFFLISEALRGEGAKLRNSKGKKFIDELELRDVVARAIFSEMEKGEVYLDISNKSKDYLKKRFPGIYDNCLKNGIDISKDSIPVEPIAHYACGGLKTDIYGMTNIPGLFAFGEVACTGVHGANRLASNSLLESMVFSSLAVQEAKMYIKYRKLVYSNTPQLYYSDSRPLEIRTELKGLMWKKAGIIRNEKDLAEALERIMEIEKRFEKISSGKINEDLIEIGNMLLVSKLIVKAALTRKESRGVHFREDYPRKNGNWVRHIVLDKSVIG